MEEASPCRITPVCFWSSLVDVLLVTAIAAPVNSTRKFLSRLWSSIQSKLNSSNSNVWAEKENSDSELSPQQTCSSEEEDDASLSRADVETVMQKLEILCSPDGEEFQERFSSKELSGLFDEKEPSLEEVKEAFDVFDENRDGFIDARELQRVLCILGFKEGKELANCNTMIRAFDENNDGRIDFNEFVRFMANIVC
ncbi:putative calcium-binding protein CML45 [Morella rubra]|uniref:Putative calcium-binding protein CML45 n=1 Tax=Morella rubra TaxID=262757 RepID=A0A6A1VIB6_9ROSI|nr:putative calcium-binding protein CML45 [Morella rubra]